MTFSRDKIFLCGVPPTKKTTSKKAPKFCDVFETRSEWSRIERRTEDDFFRLGEDNRDDGAAARENSYPLLVPDGPLKLPVLRSSWLSRLSGSNDAPLDEMQLCFGWYSMDCSRNAQEHDESERPVGGTEDTTTDLSCITQTIPRDYQLEAYCESLLKNMVIVMPTGAGKTLVAALVIKKMKMLNPDHMALFVVDRVPLVFQQGAYLEFETGLRVCMLCGENKRPRELRLLNQSRYDILVVTAGCLLHIIEKRQLDLRLFCNIVLDECHHALGEHVYTKLLREVESAGLLSSSGPRILGLTASPVSATNSFLGRSKLDELRALFGDAGIMYPNVPKNNIKLEWDVIVRSTQQRDFAIWALGELEVMVDALNRMLLPNQNLLMAKATQPQSRDCFNAKNNTNDRLLSFGFSGKIGRFVTNDDLGRILHPATMARLRGQLRNIQHFDISLFLKTKSKIYVDASITLIAALEASEVMGVKFAHIILKGLYDFMANNGYNFDFAGGMGIGVDSKQYSDVAGDKVLTSLIDSFRRRLESFSEEAVGLSPRLIKLRKHLMHTIKLSPTDDHHKSNPEDTSRAIVLVNTREVARQLTQFLKDDAELGVALNPLMVVGHGGFDGMTWFDEQEVAIEEFRNGSSRLLIATSVLEEGLDVPACDLVVRLQGARSLISFIQSRGRARKKDSKMLLLVSEEERRQLEFIREHEAQMKVLVHQGFPSVAAARIFSILGSQYGKSNVGKEQGSSTDKKGNSLVPCMKKTDKTKGNELVFQLWLVFDAFRNCDCPEGADNVIHGKIDNDNETGYFTHAMLTVVAKKI